jgi:eukaryotic-like serine/threonine-protein kinase
MLTGEVPYKAESQVGVAMKHVREPMPDPQVKRPEMSAALAAVVENATAKELKNRYANVDEMVADLEQALAIEVARSGHPTGEATSIIRALPRNQTQVLPRRLRSPRLWSVTIILVGIGVALIMVGLAMRAEPDDQPVAGPKPQPKPPTAVDITRATAFDPEPAGDGSEHDDEAARAIDDDNLTKWTTENYTQGQGLANKPGVGLYVMTEEPVVAKKMGIISTARGADVEIYGAAEPGETLEEWGEPIGRRDSMPKRSEIPLDTRGQAYGYYLIWFTKLPPSHKGDIASVTIVR